MNRIDDKLVGRFKDFIENITSHDRVGVLHHTDPDGVGSAGILDALLVRMRGHGFDAQFNQASHEVFLTGDIVSRIQESGVKKLVVTDLCIDQARVDLVTRLSDSVALLVIDHHTLYTDLNSSTVVHIKPQLLSTTVNAHEYCCSKLCYDLSSFMTDMSEHAWLACVGIRGDRVDYAWSDFMDTTRRSLGLSMDTFDEELSLATDVLFYTELCDHRLVGSCFDVACSATTFSEIYCSDLRTYHDVISSEVAYLKSSIAKACSRGASSEDDLVLFAHVTSGYTVRSVVADELSKQFPDKLVVVCQHRCGSHSYLSARCARKNIAVNVVLERALALFPDAYGGGHIHCAGGRIRREDVSHFADTLQEVVMHMMHSDDSIVVSAARDGCGSLLPTKTLAV